MLIAGCDHSMPMCKACHAKLQQEGGMLGMLSADVESLTIQNDQLLAQIRAATKLAHYADHGEFCSGGDKSTCNCGLAEARKEFDAATKEGLGG